MTFRRGARVFTLEKRFEPSGSVPRLAVCPSRSELIRPRQAEVINLLFCPALEPLLAIEGRVKTGRRSMLYKWSRKPQSQTAGLTPNLLLLLPSGCGGGWCVEPRSWVE